jgi:antitoxin (DNA-binding transcriptional repressor) of toxin-antitoxin stability system
MDRTTATLIWIDAERAIVCRWDGEATGVETVESDVPSHRRSTGHVRHVAGMRHGGGGAAQDAGEPHRLEHLRGFLADVARAVPPGDPLEIMGPGTVHERLVALLAGDDREHGRVREIRSTHSGPLTERQLCARVREFAGAAPPRRTGRAD